MGQEVTDLTVQTLLETPLVGVWDVCCAGRLRGLSGEESVDYPQLVFPYRGLFALHLSGREEILAEASRVVFFRPDRPYRVSHPVTGGDACISLHIEEELRRELTPARTWGFDEPSLRLDPRAQVMVALLRYNLKRRLAEPLEAESLALTLVRRALGSEAGGSRRSSAGHQKLAARIKVLLADDLSRRWTLSEIAAELKGGSPVYLTQVFQKVEGIPLYRYQLRLRLARALDLLSEYDDLTELSLDLGFSSHSHFSAAFREAYGWSPSEFREQNR